MQVFSPGHKLGQIIGFALEQSVYEMLLDISIDYELYLDKIGPRKERGRRKKVTWVDSNGNKHDLDFVLEKGGTEEKKGSPVAFIESAWRKYTKHSVNKAGEIANSLVPLRQTFNSMKPFTGAVVAGEWTQGGLQQMRSHGIEVLHIPSQIVFEAFRSVGIDVTGTVEDREYFARQVETWEKLSEEEQRQVAAFVTLHCNEKFAAFDEVLRKHLSRSVASVVVSPLFGTTHTFSSVDEAAEFLSILDPKEFNFEDYSLTEIFIQLRFTNGDEIEARFGESMLAIQFLRDQIFETYPLA